MSENRSANKGKSNLPGAGLSNFSAWNVSTQFLWLMSLTLNALFTTIGVGLRDLAGTECKLNVTRTFGMVENSMDWYKQAIAVYSTSCIVVIMIQTYYDIRQVCCTEKEFTFMKICKKCVLDCESVAGKKLLKNLLINTFTTLAAILYLAGDNYFLLVDLYNDDNDSQFKTRVREATRIRSFLVGTSILLTMIVFVIVEWFKDPMESKKIKCECACKEENCSYCEH